MISPSDMVLFAAVVREGSFTRAAQQLGITKQAASERIGKLEARLGVRLLERTTRRLRVTDVGGRYAERCATISAEIDEANREAQRQQAEPSGLLRVSTPVLYGRRFLGPVVASSLARYPKLKVELSLSDRRAELIEEGFDLAIRVGQLDDSSYAARKLGDGHVYCVASPTFLAAHGVPTPKTLPTFATIGMRPFETWQVAGLKHKVDPVLVVNDLEIACDAAVAGVGVARLPSLVCRDAVARGQLRVLFGPSATVLRPVYAVMPSREHLPLKVRVFVDALVALVEPMQSLEDSGLLRRRPARVGVDGGAGGRRRGVVTERSAR